MNKDQGKLMVFYNVCKGKEAEAKISLKRSREKNSKIHSEKLLSCSAFNREPVTPNGSTQQQ